MVQCHSVTLYSYANVPSQHFQSSHSVLLALSEWYSSQRRITPSSGLLRSVRWFETEVSELPIGLIFKESWPLNMEQVGSTETSVLNHLKSRNNPEDGRIHFNRGESLRSRIQRCLQTRFRVFICRSFTGVTEE